MEQPERPIIVNSLLCFIHNFRDQPDIERLVLNSFSYSAVTEAKELLKKRLQENDVSEQTDELIELFDLCSKKMDIRFAADDLKTMPQVETQTSRVQIFTALEEIRHLIKSMKESTKDDLESSPKRMKLNTSASSPEFTAVSPQPSRRKTPMKLNDALERISVKLNREKLKTEEESSPIETPASTPNSVQSTFEQEAYKNIIRLLPNPQQLFMGAMFNPLNMSSQQFSDEGEQKDDDEEGSASPSEDNKDDTPLLEMSIDNDSDKPFICEHFNCQKRFANKFLLKKHQFIHTGLRPHACPFCSKRFNRKDNLLRHKKTHAPGNVEDFRKVLPDTFSSFFSINFPTAELKNEPETESVLA